MSSLLFPGLVVGTMVFGGGALYWLLLSRRARDARSETGLVGSSLMLIGFLIVAGCHFFASLFVRR